MVPITKDDLSQALAYHQKGDRENAKKYYDKALIAFPNESDLYNGLGVFYSEMGNATEAIGYYEKAISLNPKHKAAYNNLGNVYQMINNLNDANVCYKKAIACDSMYCEAYYNLGGLYKLFKEIEKSKDYYQKAIQCNPQSAKSYNNLGMLYQEEGNLVDAKFCYEKAIELDETNSETYNNLGTLFQKNNDLGKAKYYYEKSIEVNAGRISAYFNIALVELLNRSYQKGFEWYRYRYDPKLAFAKIVHEKTLLTPHKPVEGKTLLVTKEQGFGDIIQYIRFLPFFLSQGATVICDVPPALNTLLAYNYPTICFINTMSNIAFNFNFPLLDATYLLGTAYDTIPYRGGYLSVKEEDVLACRQHYHLTTSKKKVAINYQGSKGHTNDRNRSLPLDILLEALEPLRDRIELYSLQYERNSEEDITLEKYRVMNLGQEINDFYDTAVFVKNMDVIISIDTSLVHLSGAMGKKTLVLLPFAPDWRWGLHDDKTHWYTSVTLLRQDVIGDWATPLSLLGKYL
jgi:tetratricopeptide (TPR) repeat protein